MAYEIDTLNAICATLGGTTTHQYKIDALNEWCTLSGGTGGHTQNIAALNEIDVLSGGTGGHVYDIRALNSIDIALGGSGGFVYNEFALVSISGNVNSTSLPTFSGLSSGTITDTGATVAGTVNPGGASTVWSIEYGETTAYGSTATGGTITETTAISEALTGLTPYTLYHWRIKAVNSAGTAYSDDQTLTTLVPAEMTDALMVSDVDLDSGTDVYTNTSPTITQIFWDKLQGKALGDAITLGAGTPGTGWVANGGGQFTFSGGSNGNLTFQAGTLTLNRVYRFDYEIVTGDSTGLCYINGSGSAVTNIDKTVGNRTIYFVADTGTATFVLRHNLSASGSTVIRNMVIRPVAGVHFFARATTRFPQYTKDSIAFDGSSDSILSLSGTAATTYIVARKPGADSFEVFTNLTNIGELSSNVLTVGSNTARSAFYGIAVKRIIRRNEATVNNTILNYLQKVYPTIPAPRIILPSTVYAVVGYEFNLYSDALVIGTDDSDNSPTEYDIEFVSSKGSQTGRKYSFTPVSGDVGNHTITVNVYEAGTTTLVQSKSCTINVIAATAPAAGKRVCMIGDSLTFAGAMTSQVRTSLAAVGNVPTFYGTIGSDPNKNEGHSGWSYYDLVTDASSPYVSGGAINIAAFKSTIGVANLDAVTILIGVNPVTYTEMNDRSRYTDLTFGKQLIDAFLADNPALKIIVNLPTTDSSRPDEYSSGAEKVAYQRNIWRLREMILAEFDNAEYSANVTIGAAGLAVDRFNGYAAGDEVHPINPGGYVPMSNAIFPALLKVLQ